MTNEEHAALRRDLQPRDEFHLDEIKAIRYRGRNIGDLSADQVLVLLESLIKGIEKQRGFLERERLDCADLSLRLARHGE